MHVCIPLSMGMRYHVNWHTVYTNRYIRPVIYIKTP